MLYSAEDSLSRAQKCHNSTHFVVISPGLFSRASSRDVILWGSALLRLSRGSFDIVLEGFLMGIKRLEFFCCFVVLCSQCQLFSYSSDLGQKPRNRSSSICLSFGAAFQAAYKVVFEALQATI